MSAISFGGIDLDERGHHRHDDLCGDSVVLCMKGHALSMIARACGNDAALPIVVAQSQDLVERSTLFEGAGPLQVFQFQVDRLSADFGDSGRQRTRRQVDCTANSCASLADCTKRYLGVGHGSPFFARVSKTPASTSFFSKPCQNSKPTWAEPSIACLGAASGWVESSTLSLVTEQREGTCTSPWAAPDIPLTPIRTTLAGRGSVNDRFALGVAGGCFLGKLTYRRDQSAPESSRRTEI
jgi:hypothetical protein